ncbi:hypothetical protein SAMN05421788_10575 [Filimonas lacunae]|uniref:Uncharacterized protein n=1 Tax=Filimonas lacunae TaxID=477680 RepID=A0A173MD10_9BACT|nr:hypothetical protein [Filimonas lacunae]BAV05473.1 hypothetical protein FLA_1480 [Filimonas lacunae]SIT20903.1 hypothetical protein SAMN05421788_10575 [Filimonas lacunae]
MDYFQKAFTDFNLYTGQQQPGDRGFAGLVIPGDNVDVSSIGLNDALINTGSYNSIFVFSTITPKLTAANAATFIAAVINVVGSSRAFIWLNDPENITADTCSYFSLSNDGSSTNSAANFVLGTNLTLVIQSGMGLSVNGTVLEFDGGTSGALIQLSGNQASLEATSATYGTLAFSGPDKGTVNFTSYIGLSSLDGYLQWGFQFLYTNANGELVGQWLPFVEEDADDISIGFTVCIDPSDVYNIVFDPCASGSCTNTDAYASRRTYFAFTGANLGGGSTIIASNYMNSFGISANLQPVVNAGTALPARLVITPSAVNATLTTNFIFSPEGDFTVQLPGVTNALNYNLLCGVNGTEYFTVTPQVAAGTGDTIRFISKKPAYAPLYPFSGTSSVSGNPSTLLTNQYTTSWAMLLNNASPNIQYISQPHGASLYALNQDVFKTSTEPVLGFYPSSFTLSSANTSITVPFVPYGGVQNDVANCQLLEQQIVGPVRKWYLQQDMLSAGPPAPVNGPGPSTGSILQTTSPQGLYINVDTSNNQWTLLQLAANLVEEMVNGKLTKVPYSLQFSNLQPLLQSAFQTNQLFLVMSCINQETSDSFTKNNGNEMSIEGWPFLFNIPTANPNGIFNNVLIFKFMKGVSLSELVQTPQQWTMRDDFNYTADSGSLNNLVSWLQGYISSGVNRFQVNNDNDYAKFANIATNPEWQGIIGLNVNIDLGDFPEQLQGLLAGIDLTRFNAHHFGIDLNNVLLSGGSLNMQQNSSLFGLIDYEDVIFQSFNYSISDYQQQAPIDTSADYVFKVLSLKVLFENSKITNYGSYLAMTINKLFGESIQQDNRQNLVIFQGSYEDHNGAPVYTFNSIPPSSGQTGSSSNYILNANSAIINNIQIAGASFNTLVAAEASQNQTVNSVFSLNGFIDFNSLTGFDLLSFGSEVDAVVAGQGLAFTNMYIDLSFPLAAPQATTFTFDISQMAFDPAQSYARSNSLVSKFPIQLTGILSSDYSPTPASLGYLNVQLPSLQQKQAVGTRWYALQYNLNMGTLGDLTGALGFNTTFLAVWNVGGTGATAALKLPGVNPQAPFFSLQGVIKVNIGSIQLVVADSDGGNDANGTAYLMKINNIALKLLSLSFPPGGNVNFFLFGNPNGPAQPQSVGWYTGYLQKPKS